MEERICQQDAGTFSYVGVRQAPPLGQSRSDQCSTTSRILPLASWVLVQLVWAAVGGANAAMACTSWSTPVVSRTRPSAVSMRSIWLSAPLFAYQSLTVIQSLPPITLMSRSLPVFVSHRLF